MPPAFPPVLQPLVLRGLYFAAQWKRHLGKPTLDSGLHKILQTRIKPKKSGLDI